MKEALKKHLCQRKAPLPLIAAVLYTACRIDGFPRSMKEIALSAGADHKAVSKIFTLISKHIDVNMGRVSPQQLIMRMCSELKIPPEHVDVCRLVCGTVFNEGMLEGCQQNVIAAAVLLLMISSLKIEIDITAVARVAVCEKSALISALKKLFPFSRELLRVYNIEVALFDSISKTESDTFSVSNMLVEKDDGSSDHESSDAVSSDVNIAQANLGSTSNNVSI
jgi:transcription initiation factor TFIIIB Brf1 subunit/transcription initiation factor TFIIB